MVHINDISLTPDSIREKLCDHLMDNESHYSNFLKIDASLDDQGKHEYYGTKIGSLRQNGHWGVGFR